MYGFDIFKALDTIDCDAFTEAYDILDEAYRYNNPVLTFGNGGSAAITEHVIADLVKGMGHDIGEGNYPIQALSLTTNSSLLTCLANDYGYYEAFATQIERTISYGTICLGVSSSGKSLNIVKAFDACKKRKDDGFKSIALVGFDGGNVLSEKLADVIIHVKSDNYGIVEDCHSIILHALTQKLRINTCKDITKVRL
jgi:D-sedoheptulose 7-phosphate isomerase/D-glycero-D-manno-heptose 1,7-bisphosphate phosphatase